jgi:hypothetical protein
MRNKYVECMCSTPSHTLLFTRDDEGDCEVYVSYQLNTYHAWYTRIWLAIKYVFGYSNRYGNWDCTLLDKAKVEELVAFLK